MLVHRGRLFDFGSTVFAIAGVLALALGALQLAALAYVNNKWPPVPLQQIQQEAVARSSVTLGRLDAPNVLLQVQADAVAKWLQPELQSAVLKLNESRPDLRLSVGTANVSFEGQRGSVAADFQLYLAKQDVVLSGSIEGLAYLVMDGSKLAVRPAIGKLHLSDAHSESGKAWWMPSVARLLFAELLLVRDNINGQLPAYTQALKIAPVTLAGQPRPAIPIAFPDPFRPGATITAAFVPPVLKGAALLADGDHVTILGQLSLDDVASTLPGAFATDDFLVLRREFRKKLGASGLVVNPSSDFSFDITQAFVDDMFRRFTGLAFTRDRVSEAVKASYEALPKLTRPDVGVSLDTPTVTSYIDDRLRKILDEWAAKNSGSVSTSKFEVRPQHLHAGATATFDILGAGARVGATVALTVPIAGTAAGVRLYPAIDQLAVTELRADSFGDLVGLLRGVNTFLAVAIGAANAAMQPVDVGMGPLGLGTIDFRAMAPSPDVTVTPPTYQPPSMALTNAAVLLDSSRIMLMAQSEQVMFTAVAATATVDFDTYRKAYHARWADPFGDPAQPGIAHAFIRTAAVSRYLNTAVNDANLALAASESLSSKSQTPLEIGEIPSVNCKGLLNCPSCKWWEAWCWPVKLTCEATNAGIKLACNVALQPARWAVNEMTHILGRHLGNLEADARGTVNAQARNFRLDLADDFSSVGVRTTVAADATASADLRFHAKSISGVLVCPLDFHHHVPFPSGEIHARIPVQELGMRSTIQTGLQPRPGGGFSFNVLVTPQEDIVIKGNLGIQPYLQLRLVMLSMNIQCPVTNVINVLVPGLGTALTLLDIGQITTLITDSVAQDALNGLPPEVREFYLGRIEHKIDKPEPMRLGFDIPPVRLGDTSLTMQPEIKSGLIQLHLLRDR